MFPDESTATPAGSLNIAFVPVPSAYPAVPLPTRVVTTPVDVIFRMQCLSATYKALLLSTAIPHGLLNLAFVPVPSAYPEVLPAIVLTFTKGDGSRSLLVTANVADVKLPVLVADI